MASILQQGVAAINLAFNGKEIANVNELIIVDGLVLPEVTKYHTVVQNIFAKQQIGFANPIYKVSKKKATCDDAFLDKKVSITEKFWDPVTIHIPFEQCMEDLEGTFFIWNSVQNINNPTVTDAVKFLLEMLRNAVAHDAQRIAWFASTTVALVSGGGELANTQSVTDYNHYNGFWKQVFAIMTASPANRTTITQNALGTTALQLALPADAALGYFRDMHSKADSRLLKKEAGAMLLCTRKMYDNYISSLENKPTDIGVTYLTDGSTQYTFRGIPIYNYELWDDTILDFTDGTTLDLPNRALLTTKQNLQFGINSLASIGDFNAQYDIRTDTVVIRGKYKADAKVMLNYLTFAAY